jgi:hypothetical protein
VLHVFTDFDWACNASDKRITSGCCFSLVSCFSRNHVLMALSLVEIECMVDKSTSCEAI